ncbi:hypothetical protein ACX80D_16915 [Arthrobacter sp. Sr24]
MFDNFLPMNPESLRDYLESTTDPKALLRRFDEKALPTKIKYVENRAAGVGAVKECIDVIAETANFSHFVFSNDESTTTLASNMSLFASNFFWEHFDRFRPSLARFDYDDAIGFVLNKSNVVQLQIRILRDRSIRISPNLAVLVAMSSSYYGLDSELETIRVIVSNMAPTESTDIAREILSKRIRSLSVSPPNVAPEIRNGDHALMITGQLRGFRRSLPQIWKTVINPSDTDVYISTWLNPGAATIDEHRLQRRFTAEATEMLRTAVPALDISDLRAYVKRTEICLSETELRQTLKDMFPNARSVHVNIVDGEKFPYSSMDNPSKMYFHNAYWIETLGKPYFNSNYGTITKIRPDYQLSMIPGESSNIYSGSSLSADLSGWVLDVWGFGMADQLFSGCSIIMTELLTIKFPESISTRAMVRMMRRDRTHMGHINLAIEAWTMGAIPTQIRHKKFSFSEVDRLDVDFVKTYLGRRSLSSD